uniref:hypothetical protein n=1 Tax=Sutcliffiella horikoshii TaxID=79883 RepID=UPI001CFE76E6
RKLSSSAPMVVGGSPPVRVGRCQANLWETSAYLIRRWFFVLSDSVLSELRQNDDRIHGKEKDLSS